METSGLLDLYGMLQEKIFQDEESGEDIENDVEFLTLAAEETDEDIGNDAEGDTFGDAVEQRHGNDADISGNGRIEVLFRHFQLGHVAEHEEAHNDEGWSRSKGRHSSEDRGEQRGNEEEEGCSHGR